MSDLLRLVNSFVPVLDQAPVVLGPIIFADYEIPSRINLGGAQAVVVHRLPGGGRIIDAMGVDDSAIAWQGHFSGPEATARARLVDSIRQSGQPVIFSFGDYTFSVIVVHYEYDLQARGMVIPYRIRAEIAPAQFSQVITTTSTLATSLSMDIDTVVSILSDPIISMPVATLRRLQMAVVRSGDPISASNIIEVQYAIQLVTAEVQASILSSGKSLTSNHNELTYSSFTGDSLEALVSAAEALSLSTQAAAYVNRSNCWVNELAGQAQSVSPIYA